MRISGSNKLLIGIKWINKLVRGWEQDILSLNGFYRSLNATLMGSHAILTLAFVHTSIGKNSK